jgi:integrase
MKGRRFVLDTVRALFEWAADTERGNLLPEGFHNPFLRWGRAQDVFVGDQLAEPDITLPMTIRFVQACDAFQLRLFVPLIMFGLRAAEPCLLFREHVDQDWLSVLCIPELDHATKGRRDKRLPLIAELQSFWAILRSNTATGLLFERRSVVEKREMAPLRGASLNEVAKEYRRRCAAAGNPAAVGREQVRDEVIHQAGGLNYDQIEQEFHSIRRRLGWPAQATLKDFRHSFATMLGNSPMAEAYKKYLMGQSPGRAALNAYTHLNQIREQFSTAVHREWPSLLQVITDALQSTGLANSVANGRT